ncbi:MAG TPA: PilZ domain-containing protein [Byssovorax sp.]|jgi:hypothetical protein
MSDPDGERRGGMRHFTCYPFHIQRGEAGETSDVEIALIRDVSAAGAYLLVRAAPAVGDRVKLHLDVFDAPKDARVVVGRVVRVEARPADESDVWQSGVAVQFDAPDPELDAAAERLATGPSAR